MREGLGRHGLLAFVARHSRLQQSRLGVRCGAPLRRRGAQGSRPARVLARFVN